MTYSYFQFPYRPSSLNWLTKRAHDTIHVFYYKIVECTIFLQERLPSEPFLKLIMNVLLMIFLRYLFVQIREIIAD